MSVSLLYMFISRLVVFRTERTQYFVESHRGSSIKESVETGYVSSDSNGNFNLNVVYDTLHRRTTEDRDFMSKDIQSIFKLHDLIKKQSILVCIAILSSVTVWSLVAVVNYFFWWLVWDVSINTICVWLMLKSSRKYWICCGKYGVCACCYCKENSAFV